MLKRLISTSRVRTVDALPSIIQFSQLHVNRDKEGSPNNELSMIMNFVRLSSACNRTV